MVLVFMLPVSHPATASFTKYIPWEHNYCPGPLVGEKLGSYARKVQSCSAYPHESQEASPLPVVAGDAVQVPVPPFGLTSAPKVFTKLMNDGGALEVGDPMHDFYR